MSDWIVRPISALCTHVVDCVNKTAPLSSTATQFKMLRTTNIRNGWVDDREVKHVTQETYCRWTRRLRPQRGDVVLTREAPLGQVGLVRSDGHLFLGQRLVMFRIDPLEADARFLMYAMLGPDVQAEIRRLGSGATVEHLRVPDCETLPIAAPSLLVQRKIGDVLGVFDDLIANNSRRIEILEEAVRLAYRRIVTATQVLSEPSIVTFEQLCRSVTQSIDPRSIDPDTPAVGLEHLPRRSTTLVEWGVAEELGSRKLLFQPEDVLFGKIRPYFHKVAVAPISGVCSTDIIVLRPLRPDVAGLVSAVASSDEFVAYAVRTSNGTKMPRADWRVLGEFPVTFPSDAEMGALSDQVLALTRSASAMGLENRALSRARDLLLPKLVTGRLDVNSLGVDDVFGWTDLVTSDTP